MMFQGTAPAPDDLSGVNYLFTDIDDTLTTDGRLLPQTYQALWDLAEAGISIIPVTGGSAGWCEHIVRAWPVVAAIGESGAFVLRARGNRADFEFWDDEARQRSRQEEHLAAILPLLGGQFQLAHDQCLRVADVAIDIVGHARPDIDQLADRIRAMGGTVAISSVHINTWLGHYDKKAMSERVLHGLGVEAADVARHVTFVGDSRNDAPMFGFVGKSFGVANIASILGDLPQKPRWITSSPAGLGFVEMATALLQARGR